MVFIKSQYDTMNFEIIIGGIQTFMQPGFIKYQFLLNSLIIRSQVLGQKDTARVGVNHDSL